MDSLVGDLNLRISLSTVEQRLGSFGMGSVILGVGVLSVGQGLIQASQFLRNVILARLISPAEYGVAALFAVTLQVVEMLTNVSTEAFLVHSESGDDQELQGTLQSFKALRGLCSGLLIVLLGGSVASLFGVPHAAWAFRCLGLLPAMRGLAHLDVSRLQRHMRFLPFVASEAGASWIATVAIAPLAFWFRDHRAMLAILVAQGLTSMVLSHTFAERRYTMTWSKEYWRKLVTFGWPLTVNGILMFGIFQGDRIVVGSAQQLFPRSNFTLADLGIYSAGFSLAQAPTMFLANAASSLFLPILSRLQNAGEEFNRKYIVCYQAVCLTAAVTAAVFLTSGSVLVSIVFGSRYSTGPLVIGLIGAMWAVRIVRVAPTIAALAVGDTRNTMWANGVRSLGLVGMGFAAYVGAELLWIPFAGFVGELLALAANIIRLRGHTPVNTSMHFVPLLLTIGAMGSSALVGRYINHQPVPLAIAVSFVTIATAATVMLATFNELRAYIVSSFRRGASLRA